MAENSEEPSVTSPPDPSPAIQQQLPLPVDNNNALGTTPTDNNSPSTPLNIPTPNTNIPNNNNPNITNTPPNGMMSSGIATGINSSTGAVVTTIEVWKTICI